MYKRLEISCLCFIVLLLFITTIIPVHGEEKLDHNSQITDIIYDGSGQIVSFFVPNDASTMITHRSANFGVYEFIGGTCIVVELLTGYSCIQIARALGLTLINGIYTYERRPYSGKWKVTYGYKPGCQPQHSGVCFGATYTRIG